MTHRMRLALGFELAHRQPSKPVTGPTQAGESSQAGAARAASSALDAPQCADALASRFPNNRRARAGRNFHPMEATTMPNRSKTAFSPFSRNAQAIAWVEFVALAGLAAILASQIDLSAAMAGLERWIDLMGHPYARFGRGY